MLLDRLNSNQINTQNMIEPGKIYKHYKGKMYKVLHVARFSEDPDTLFVVYQALYDCPTYGENQIWCRPLSMFTEIVEVNGVMMPRFKKDE